MHSKNSLFIWKNKYDPTPRRQLWRTESDYQLRMNFFWAQKNALTALLSVHVVEVNGIEPMTY